MIMMTLMIMRMLSSELWQRDYDINFHKKELPQIPQVKGQLSLIALPWYTCVQSSL